ncbi:MAG: metalloregulator ArsR/SmtB family transcription factor [Candidatus Aminicenantes bacterium]|nr:metalloregulator ArsR/SmtB family transcription factor [Candidatus Aminicenantes bacterium]
MTDMLRVFKSLSDRTRLRIVRLLLEHDLCVCEIMFVLEMAQSRVSHQLRILRDAGLVEDVRDGQWIIYRIPSLVRTTIRPLLELFPRETEKSTAEETADRNKLKVCLKNGIRKKKFSGRGNRAGNTSSNPRTGGSVGH